MHHGHPGQEMARSTPGLKKAFERGLEEILAAGGGDRKEAILQLRLCSAASCWLALCTIQLSITRFSKAFARNFVDRLKGFFLAV